MNGGIDRDVTLMAVRVHTSYVPEEFQPGTPPRIITKAYQHPYRFRVEGNEVVIETTV